jgi:hypothetical protein
VIGRASNDDGHVYGIYRVGLSMCRGDDNGARIYAMGHEYSRAAVDEAIERVESELLTLSVAEAHRRLALALGESDVSARRGALDAAWEAVQEVARQPESSAPLRESTSTAVVLDGPPCELVEALRRDGTVPIKLIAPGWSANGRYYGADVLERDGATAFPKGTHMYWDHPSASEESDRPERSLRDLAGVLTGDARYRVNGPSGPGLYADAQIMSDYQAAVADLAPHIGVSIRAEGAVAYGETGGRSGQIVQSITRGRSADFVTTPAAGGRVITAFESHRR